jgi:tRNA-dihydrouridine synthase B
MASYNEAKHFIETGTLLPEVTVDERWELVLRHCRMAVESRRNGNEKQTLTAMRSRLMAYCKGFPGAKELRQKLCQVVSISQVEDLAALSLGQVELAEL